MANISNNNTFARIKDIHNYQYVEMKKDKMCIYASSNEIAVKSNRAIYYSFDRKRDCRIAYVFPRMNVGDRSEGWCRGLRERGVARCIQKCIWLPGKRSMEQHGNALCDLGEQYSYRFLINSRRFFFYSR